MRRTIMVAAVLAAVFQTGCGGGTGGSEREAAAPVGQAEFRPCAVCHATAPLGTAAGDVRLVGPNLHGVYGRKAASLENYAYTRALRESGIVWDEATLDAYIENPQALVRGTRMSYLGEPDPEKRKAIIVYMQALR